MLRIKRFDLEKKLIEVKRKRFLIEKMKSAKFSEKIQDRHIGKTPRKIRRVESRVCVNEICWYDINKYLGCWNQKEKGNSLFGDCKFIHLSTEYPKVHPYIRSLSTSFGGTNLCPQYLCPQWMVKNKCNRNMCNMNHLESKEKILLQNEIRDLIETLALNVD